METKQETPKTPPQLLQQAVELNNQAALAHVNFDAKLSEKMLLSLLDWCPQQFKAMCWVNLAHVYNSQNRFTDARDAIIKGLSLIGDSNADVWANCGMILTNCHDHIGAQQCYKHCLKLDKTKLIAQHNLSTSQLLTGNYKEGWVNYDARLEAFPRPKAMTERIKLPTWQGEKDAKLYCYSEQGIGDAIFFARFLHKLQNKKIKLEIQKSLVSLFQLNFPSIEVIGRGDADPDHPQSGWEDCTHKVSICSLARYLHSVEGKSYLTAPKADVGDGCKIGLCHVGNPDFSLDSQRSIELKKMLPLAELQGIKWYNFAKSLGNLRFHPSTGLRYMQADFPLQELELTDWLDTASKLQAMDLVISVDTAVLHLAGALGVPAYGLVYYNPDFRWGINDVQSRFYDNIKLLRQHKYNDWDGVIQQCVTAIMSANTV